MYVPIRRIRVVPLAAALVQLSVAAGLPAAAEAQERPTDQLFRAAHAGDAHLVFALLRERPDLLEAKDGDGLTPLLHAVVGGHARLAHLLLDRGADISAQDADGWTPLHRAAFAGDTALVTLLLDRGADVMARQSLGRTPLFMAAWGNSLGAVERLIAAGADVNDRTEGGEQILFSTLFNGTPEVVNALLAAGARLPDDEASLRRATGLAAGNGFEDVFHLATTRLEELEIPWWEDVSMHTAARGGVEAVGEALLAHGAAVDEKNMYGVTPLHIAAENGRLAFVEFLVAHGAVLDATHVTGMRAYHFALANHHDSVAARLRELGASTAPAVFPDLRGPWLGQRQPGRSPERFAVGIVSSHRFINEHSPAAFSPDGAGVYWSTSFYGGIAVSRLERGRWTAPRAASFVSEYGDGEPIFSPDGQRLFFNSRRPLEPGGEPGKENLWFVERIGGGWSEPRPVDAVVNEYEHHWLFSVSRGGTLYFSSVREGGYGARDIYRSRYSDGAYQAPENIGSVINTPGIEHTPFIAPDESYLIFASNRDDFPRRRFRFFISYRQADGGWSPPNSLDHVTGPVANVLCPLVTADGKFLFFIGDGDVWWVRADFIEEMRP